MKLKELTLSNSGVALYQLCPRKYALRYIYRVTPQAIGQKPEADLGTLIHKWLEAPTLDIEGFLNSSAHTFSTDGLSQDKSHILKLLTAYADRYFIPGTTKDKEFEVLNAEQTVTKHLTDINGVRVYFTGTVDKLVRLNTENFKGQPRTALVDHKTSKSIENYVKPVIHLADQATAYTWLMEEKSVDCFIYDTIPTSLKALQNFEKNGEELFYRFTTVRTAEQIDDWKKRVTFVAKQIIECAEEDFFLSNQPFACFSYFKRCYHADLCESSGDERINILNSYSQLPETSEHGFAVEENE